MEPSHNAALALWLAVLICACLSTALPVGGSDRADLTQLVNLMGKLKTLDSHPSSDNSNRWAALGDEADKLRTGDKLSALKRGFLGFNKRQGGWTYDYGLGGGRFGKRYYGDYGIGGGRFGRDVDHVDVVDANDSNL